MPERRANDGPRPGPGEIVRAGLCIGCGSCVAQGRPRADAAADAAADADAHAAVMTLDRYGELKPRGAPAWLREGPAGILAHLPLLAEAADESQLADALFADDAPCIDSQVGRLRAAYVGHAAEAAFANAAARAAWSAGRRELLRTGMVDAVAHVAPARRPPLRLPALAHARRARGGAKSRYYPVEMSQVLQTIRACRGAMRWSACPASSRRCNCCGAKTR
jgi:coenzyme F420-reducing hydrogenase beta subunit